MNYIRTRLLVLCVLVAALVAVGCGNSAPANKSTTAPQAKQPLITEGLKQSGTLTVGLHTSIGAPFITETGDGISGMDVDLASSLASELGLDVAFTGITDAAQGLGDKCDIVMNTSASEGSSFDVMGDYAESALALFHVGEPTVMKAEALDGKRFALQDGSSAQQALRVTALTVTEVPCKTLGEAFDSLKSGDADYVLCNASTGAYLASRREGISFAGAFSEPEPIGIALPSGDGAAQTAMREAYDRLSKNGELTEIRKTWLGNMPTLTKESVVADIPMRETTGESLNSISTGSEVLSNAMDGSTAGANAVSPSEAAALVSSGGTSGTQTSSDAGQTQTYATQTYTDYSGYSDYSDSYVDYSSAGTDYSSYDSSNYGSDYSSTDYAAGGYSATDYGGDATYTETYGY